MSRVVRTDDGNYVLECVVDDLCLGEVADSLRLGTYRELIEDIRVTFENMILSYFNGLISYGLDVFVNELYESMIDDFKFSGTAYRGMGSGVYELESGRIYSFSKSYDEAAEFGGDVIEMEVVDQLDMQNLLFALSRASGNEDLEIVYSDRGFEEEVLVRIG